ncbi:MAG: thiolase family protein, partial [Rhodococcus sp. (in: high G+C Gram-positive bacteria)]|uniref:thiolase family protein n=1 Tax=Rhodococcus sp. TaxID=1831 RepID=UPI003BB09BA7
MRDAVIVDAVRSPIGRRGRSLADIHPANLSAHVLGALAERTGLEPASVDDVIWGCVGQVAEQAGNVARTAVLAANWPETVPGVTLTRACGSSQQAVSFAAATVISGQNDVVVAGGVEMMSRVPMGSASKNGEHFPPNVLERFGIDGFSQGVGAEMMAEKWGLTRTALDEFSLRSHELSAAATDAGAFTGQIAPIAGLSQDEGIRRGGTLESLGKLPTAFKEDGVIHAGNASQISDGAGAVLVTTSEYAAQQGWTPIVRIHTAVVAADDPVIMLT